VLEIAIHGDDVLAARMVEPGGETGGLTEIPAELYDGDTAVDGGDFTEKLEGTIGGAIVNEDNLKAVAVGLHNVLEAVVKVGDILLLVMQRDHNRILWHGSFYYTGKSGESGFLSIL
jgi:hypothetical protein